MSDAQTAPAPQPSETLKPAEGQSLIWKLIALERPWPVQILAFVGFLLSFLYIFGWTPSMAVAMIVSMFLHECGHAFVFWLAKIRFIILYLFPLGAVAAPIDPEENKRSDQLHWWTIACLLQAGPAVNVLLMLLFAAIQQATSGDVAQFARDMVYINGLLATMNLIPVWTLDAGQLFRVIYSSLEEKEDTWLTGILITGVFFLLLGFVIIPGMGDWALILANTLIRFGWVVFLLAFTLAILNKQGRDDPLHAFSRQAMTNLQVLAQVVFYLVMVGITLWLFAGPLF